jgi:hypothetical protein
MSQSHRHKQPFLTEARMPQTVSAEAREAQSHHHKQHPSTEARMPSCVRT